MQHGLSDHGLSDNTGHSTLFAWSRKNPIYPMYFTTVCPTFYHGLSDNTGHPTFFAGPKRSFTTDYPTFFVTARESREKIKSAWEQCIVWYCVLFGTYFSLLTFSDIEDIMNNFHLWAKHKSWLSFWKMSDNPCKISQFLDKCRIIHGNFFRQHGSSDILSPVPCNVG